VTAVGLRGWKLTRRFRGWQEMDHHFPGNASEPAGWRISTCLHSLLQ
jgi:hypothetical protein